MTTPSELLEREAYNDCNTIAKCFECGEKVDVEEYHGKDRSGERYCCDECMGNSVKCCGFVLKHNNHWCMTGEFDDIQICVTRALEKDAVDTLEDIFDALYDKNCYYEVD